MRIKTIASQGEMRADKILRRSLDGTQWLIYANVSLQAVLQREERLSPAAFSMLTRGSFDFVLCDDQDYQPIFALELDGFGHSDSRQVARDLLKNAFCKKAGLPLLRIGVDDLRERDEYSVLEWLIGAFAASEQESEEELEASEDEMDFPWDPWGVASELALHDALRQAEGWARSRLARRQGRPGN